MADRTRAILILKQARQMLLDRLAERITELGDEILEDAQGHCYSSQIESIHDEIGVRLANVNNMLAGLDVPGGLDFALPEDETDSHDDRLSGDGESQQSSDRPSGDRLRGLLEPNVVAFAEDAMERESDEANRSSETASDEANFASFLGQIREGDLAAAGRTIAVLLDLDEKRGRRCADYFDERLAASPTFLQKAMSLRGAMSSGSVNDALMLLWECFGLQGPESIGAMQALKMRLSGA